MEEKKLTLQVSKLLATCLQRMLVEEIENQERWKAVSQKHLGELAATETRDEIIAECKELQEELEKLGIKKYFNCRGV